MREQGYGKIINTSSMVVATAMPMFLHYVASKSGDRRLTRSLAREVARYGIAVNTISPCLRAPRRLVRRQSRTTPWAPRSSTSGPSNAR